MRFVEEGHRHEHQLWGRFFAIEADLGNHTVVRSAPLVARVGELGEVLQRGRRNAEQHRFIQLPGGDNSHAAGVGASLAVTLSRRPPCVFRTSRARGAERGLNRRIGLLAIVAEAIRLFRLTFFVPGAIKHLGEVGVGFDQHDFERRSGFIRVVRLGNDGAVAVLHQRENLALDGQEREAGTNTLGKVIVGLRGRNLEKGRDGFGFKRYEIGHDILQL